MTTHRNLKPHYSEPKGKSGPVVRIPAPLSDSMTEDELLQAITETATYKGWRWHHIRRSDKAVQQGHSGFPDLVMAKDGRLMFLELKSESGKPSPDQAAWLLELTTSTVYARIVRPRDLDEILGLL